MKLSDERYEEIKNIVGGVFGRYNITTIPINPFELAHKMGFKISPYSSLDPSIRLICYKFNKDGFLLKSKDDYNYIFYNDNRITGRINNTIMHEIGHYVLDHGQESDLAEAEANFFAKYTLAPPVLIYKYKLKNAEEIAKTFEVSNQAAKIAWDYYIKWLKFSGINFRDYECKILNLFKKPMQREVVKLNVNKKRI